MYHLYPSMVLWNDTATFDGGDASQATGSSLPSSQKRQKTSEPPPSETSQADGIPGEAAIQDA